MSDVDPNAPRFANPTAVIKTVQLAFPVVFQGKTYSTVCLRKFSVRDLKLALERVNEARKEDPTAPARLPMYYTEDGAPIPPEVMENLEVDDFDAIDEAASGFLPRRFQQAATMQATASDQNPSESTSASGDSTEPMSSA